MLSDDTLYGTLCAVDPAPQTLTSQQAELLVVLARLLATQIERACLFDSERQAREEAQGALQLRDEFLSAIGHDLGTPLTSIKGAAQLMQRRLGRAARPPDPAALGRLAAGIVESADRMAALVADMLDLTRLRSGQPLELHRAPADLVALCRRVEEEHRVLNGQAEIALEAPEPEFICTCDGARLERVVSNLVGNAVKYSLPDRCRITISVARDPGAKGWAVLSVRDEGIGTPAEELGQVLELYYRATNVPAQSQGSCPPCCSFECGTADEARSILCQQHSEAQLRVTTPLRSHLSRSKVFDSHGVQYLPEDVAEAGKHTHLPHSLD